MSGAPSLLFVVVAVLLCILQPYLCPYFPFLPLIPIGYELWRGVGGETNTDKWICSLVWCAYHAIIMYPVSLILFFIPYQWCLLSAYSLFFCVFYRHLLRLDDETIAEKLWYKLWIDIFWNAPLMIAWYIVAYFGGQLSAPLVSIIDERICLGSFPCNPTKVKQLYDEPYHIRAVINLCDEDIGPVREYERYKIKFLHLKTLDVTPVSIENIELGIKFIDEFLKSNNDEGRVFIHCKAGRSRSVSMTLCWYLSQGVDVKVAMKKLKSCRRQASSYVLRYNTIKHFIRKYKQGNF